MANLRITWDLPTLDTAGAVLTDQTAVVVFKDGVPLANKLPGETFHDHSNVPAGFTEYSVRVDTIAGVGVESDPVSIVVPTGIAAAPDNVIVVLI